MRRLAELKFDVRHVVYREGSFERGKDMKLPLSDIKKYIVDNFNKEDSVVSIDIDKIYSKNVTIDNELSRGGGEQLFISPPKSMRWELFLTLLGREGLLDEDKVRRLFRRGVQKRAELKFDVRHVVYSSSVDDDVKFHKLPLSGIKKYIADNFNKKGGVVSIDEDKNTKDVVIYNEAQSNYGQTYKGESLELYSPKGMKWELFLTLLEREGLLDEDKVRRLFRRGVQKRAELHFDVEITRYHISNLHKGNERFRKLANTKQRFTFNEIKDSLFSTSEDYERNQKTRDSYFFSRYDFFQRDGVITARFTFKEEIEEWDSGYITYIYVTKPDHLSKKLFESMIKGAANVIR